MTTYTTPMTLTHERLRELLHYDPETGVFTWRASPNWRIKAGAVAGTAFKRYVRIKVDKRSYLAHRLAWFYVHGVWPADQIDHEDRTRANNAFTNLREATNAQNGQNRPPLNANNTSGTRGVAWHKKAGKWAAQIMAGGKKRHLGVFDTQAEAVEFHDLAHVMLHPFSAEARSA